MASILSNYGPSWFAFRAPGMSEAILGSSRRLIYGFENPGFTIVPFDLGGKYKIITIPKDNDEAPWLIHESISENDHTISSENHKKSVETIVSEINKGGLEKVVLARIERQDVAVDLQRAFYDLCAIYPQAYVFSFSTPFTGAWIGASPELLMAGDKFKIKTMALAGTMPVLDHSPWSEKNIQEHEYVRCFIAQTLSEAGLVVDQSELMEVKAGPVKHLLTKFTSYFSDSSDNIELSKIALRLSPTPALSGFPRDIAIEVIKREEGFDRTYYGGFCGFMDSEGKYDYCVNLRSARINKTYATLYAGGGIVKDSVAEKEWEETNLKLSTLKGILLKEGLN